MICINRPEVPRKNFRRCLKRRCHWRRHKVKLSENVSKDIVMDNVDKKTAVRVGNYDCNAADVAGVKDKQYTAVGFASSSRVVCDLSWTSGRSTNSTPRLPRERCRASLVENPWNSVAPISVTWGKTFWSDRVSSMEDRKGSGCLSQKSMSGCNTRSPWLNEHTLLQLGHITQAWHWMEEIEKPRVRLSILICNVAVCEIKWYMPSARYKA